VAPGFVADLKVIDAERIGLNRPELINDLPAGAGRFVQRAGGYAYAVVKSGQVTYDHGSATGALRGTLERGAAPTRRISDCASP
jgi:N-acyl-D-amino-acid deacylase